MKERTRHKIKMGIMIGLTFGFFLVEIVVGYITKSLALVSDSFHMISDVLALIIGLACICLSTKESKKNTYGYARAEIIGALINSVFLIALCFSIFIEAIQRLVSPEGIHDPDLLLIVGGVGLGVNVIGLMLFCNETIGHGHSHGGDGGGHGHSHGGSSSSNHGHSHGGDNSNHGHSHGGSGGHGHGHGGAGDDDNSHGQAVVASSDANPPISMTFVGANAAQQGQSGYLECIIIDTGKTTAGQGVSYLQSAQLDGRQITSGGGEDKKRCSDKTNEEGFVNTALDDNEDDGDDEDDEPRGIITTVSHIVGGPVIEETSDVIVTQSGEQVKAKKTKSGQQMNIQGVFLHILGDALGSVVVIISALVVKYNQGKGDWVDRIDPILSIIMVIIILASTIPLFKQSALILLQNVPNNMNVNNLVEKLKTEVEGLANVHDLHVWQLVGSRVIASMHIRCTSLSEYVKTSKKIKSFFHENGIHSTTIQPEFTEHKDKPTSRECYLECGPELQCFVNTCCSAKKSERMKLLQAAVEEEEHQEEQRQMREQQLQQQQQEGSEPQNEDHHDHHHDHDHDHHHDHDHGHHHNHDHGRDQSQCQTAISIEAEPVAHASDFTEIHLESSESRL